MHKERIEAIKEEIANRKLMIRNIIEGEIKSLNEIIVIEGKIIEELERIIAKTQKQEKKE